MYICITACIKKGRLYNVGQRYQGIDDPGKHFLKDPAPQKKEFVVESAKDMMIQAMSPKQLVENAEAQYGVSIDPTGKSREELSLEYKEIAGSVSPRILSEISGDGKTNNEATTKARGRRKISEIIKVEE